MDASFKIAQMGYSGQGDVAEIVDRAQQVVFEVAENKINEDYQPSTN